MSKIDLVTVVYDGFSLRNSPENPHHNDMLKLRVVDQGKEITLLIPIVHLSSLLGDNSPLVEGARYQLILKK